MAEQEKQVEAVAAEDEENDNPDYKAPAPKSLDEILGQDLEDESLRKYKEQLLAEAGSGEKIVVGEAASEQVTDVWRERVHFVFLVLLSVCERLTFSITSCKRLSAPPQSLALPPSFACFGVNCNVCIL